MLADATADPARLGGPARTLDFPIPGVGKAPLLRPRKAERMPPFETLMDAEEAADLEEHWRLLYVALTRASERLVVAGLDTSNSRGEMPENSWHVRVERALASARSDACGRTMSGAKPWPIAARVPPRGQAEGGTDPCPAPARSRLGALARARRGSAAAPAGAVRHHRREFAFAAAGPGAAEAARRGELAPSPVRAAARCRAGAAARAPRCAGSSARRASPTQARAPSLPMPPAPSSPTRPSPSCSARISLAEAPIAATLADGRVVAGTVDRLLVEPTTGPRHRLQDRSQVPADAGRCPARAHRARWRPMPTRCG